MVRFAMLGCALLLSGCNAIPGFLAETPSAAVAPVAVEVQVPADVHYTPIPSMDCRPGRGSGSEITC